MRGAATKEESINTRKLVQLPAAALIALLGVQSASASVDQSDEHHSPMTYVGSVLASAVYFPAKVVLAAGGAVASGVTYVATLGNPEPTRKVWDASVEGDYVVTPRMIEGREDVDFIGPS